MDEKRTLSIQETFSKAEQFAFAAAILVLTVIFQHGDMNLVGALSFKYLHGHFLDFYDVSKSEYLPTTYILFAIWNIPLWLMGVRIVDEPDVGLSIFWMKMLPYLFTYFSLRQFLALCKEMGMTSNQAQWNTLVWITSPVFLFGVVLFGQLDIITVFLTLWALRFYRKGNLVPFSLLLGIAITFKYFPFFVFVPLLLLVEKRPARIALNGLVFAIPYALVVLPYLASPAFHSDVLSRSIVQRVFTMGTPYIHDLKLSFFVAAWVFICGFAYYRHTENQEERDTWSIYLCLASLTALFSLVLWHPQWLVWLTPFIVLATLRHQRRAFFLTVETAFFFFMVAFSCQFFPQNVDEQMLVHGVLGATGALDRINPHLMDPQHALTMGKIYGMFPLPLAISCVAAAQFIMLFFAYPKRAEANVGWEASLTSLQGTLGTLRMRYYGGLALFVVPALLCLFMPANPAGRTWFGAPPPSPTAPAADAYDLGPPNSVTQVFVPGRARVTHLLFQAQTLILDTRATLLAELQDPNGAVIFREQVRLSTSENGGFLAVPLKGITMYPDRPYRCTLTPREGLPTKVLRFSVTGAGTATKDQVLLIDGRPTDRSLIMKVYGE